MFARFAPVGFHLFRLSGGPKIALLSPSSPVALIIREERVKSQACAGICGATSFLPSAHLTQKAS